ncbi:MAG: PD-(D/E)XK nuclease family protein [Oligoflexia bacterium]|nr:PD-(D/E)XK nuclease family protein [Oligoflexia bacterium]
MSRTTFASLIPVKSLQGLHPSVGLAVGPGFAREEIKSFLLSRGTALTSDAVTTAQDLARKVLNAFGAGITAEAVLGGLARQEVLRLLVAERRIAARLGELKKLRRQGGFFRRLDQAIQAGRLAAAHADEEEVLAERLEQRFGKSPVRDELRLLARAYEAWLTGAGLWDPPLLLRTATERLYAEGWPERLVLPEEILHFTLQHPESLERSFWDALGTRVRVSRPSVEVAAAAGGAAPAWGWERWHTLDDACERLAEALSRETDLSRHAVLIADSPMVRRSLKRALRDWGIPEADPRDPARLQLEEAVKWALLPLEVVGRGFERANVAAWIRAFLADEEAAREGSRWIAEAVARGLRLGIPGYRGGVLEPVHARLQTLQTVFGGRKRCEELGRAHGELLRAALAERRSGGAQPPEWVLGFFEEIWKEFAADLERLGLGTRRAPPLYWLERLEARIREAPAPVERVRPSEGLAVYRLQQAPLTGAEKLWVLGLPAQWLSSEGGGDTWLGARDREVLSAEFAVRSGIQSRAERLAALKAWAAAAESVTVLDALHDPDGRERELIFPVLKEWAGPELPEGFPQEPLEKGSHPRWSPSYGVLRAVPPQQVRLAPAAEPRLTATALDRYSRCPFQSLVMDRWRLRDAREPDCELWADSRGNILHEAVRILVDTRTEEGAFTVSPADALERAWKSKPPKGLLRSRSVERYLRARMRQVLEAFCEKEREYFDRARPRVLSLDNTRLEADFGGITVSGTPDRIDETTEGLFVMDYKTSGTLPSGAEMAEQAYRLQLPFYAIAAARQFGKPVLGVQFVELSRKGSRSSGLFFKRTNGKDPGKLTHVRSNSKSLMPGEPEALWPVFEERIAAHAAAFARGEFPATAKRPEKECQSCAAADICGFRRRVSEGLLEEAERGADA